MIWFMNYIFHIISQFYCWAPAKWCDHEGGVGQEAQAEFAVPIAAVALPKALKEGFSFDVSNLEFFHSFLPKGMDLIWDPWPYIWN